MVRCAIPHPKWQKLLLPAVFCVTLCCRSGTPVGAEYCPDPSVFSDDAPAGDTPCPSGNRQRAI